MDEHESNSSPPPSKDHETETVCNEYESKNVDAVEEDMDDSVKLRESSSSKKTEKSRTSDVWKYFTRIGAGDDGKERAKCNGCKKKYVIGSQNGTSHLKRHMEKCTKLKFEDVRQMIVDGQGKLKARRIDPMVCRQLCVNLIIQHGLPFNFVEYEALRIWISYINHDACLVSRNTIKNDVMKIHMKEKNMLKEA